MTQHILKTKEQILEERKEYYEKTFVLFEMVKCLKFREFSMLTLKTEKKKKAIRFLSCSTIDFMKKHLKFFYHDQSLLNFYTSVAKFKDHIPVFSYNLEKRSKEEKYRDFSDNYLDYVDNFDLFIDIDGKDVSFEKLHNEAKIIKHIFDELEIPYYIMPSSYKGFHIHIPSEYMPKWDFKESIMKTAEVINNIKGIYELECLDDTVTDFKRLCKLPYSYSCDGSICLPLNDLTFMNFKPYMIEMNNVLRFQRLMNRGLLIRTYGYKEETLKKNVLKLFDEYG